MNSNLCFGIALSLALIASSLAAQDASRWSYAPESMQPFWQADRIEGEPVLFMRDAQSNEARATLLFPIEKIDAVRSSAGDVTYQEGVDFHFDRQSREIVVPADSQIVTKLPEDLRRPAKSQAYLLTHRDGKGEIFFGAKLEYHQMQTLVSYTPSAKDWTVKMPAFDADVLPRTVAKLREGRPLAIVLLGDSISTGCNASGWANGAPFQPPYQDLLQQHLEAYYQTEVSLTNLAVGGTATPWGLTRIKEVVQPKPDLVILAFGMNDSSGISAEDYGKNTAAMIANTRASLPETEFILVASMLGNRDWTILKHELFPKYRDELAKLCAPGIALADLTSVWDEFLKRKKDWDLTGNGVNHPNDFGHRVYAQVIAALLVDPESKPR